MTDQPVETPNAGPGTHWWNLARWVLGLISLAGVVGLCSVIVTDGPIPAKRLEASLLALIVGSIGCGWASLEYRRAYFALAHVSEGTVLVANETPADSERQNSVVFLIEAPLREGVTLRRRVEVVGWHDPDSWVGRTVPFRHRTLEPDLLTDAYIGVEEMYTVLYAEDRTDTDTGDGEDGR